MKKISLVVLLGIIIGAAIATATVALTSKTALASTTNNITTIPTGLISELDAKSIMLNKVPGGSLIKFKFNNSATPSYQGKIVNQNVEYDINLNAKNGDIISINKSKDDNNTSIISTNANIIAENNFIQPEKAKTIALDKVPGGQLTGFSLDYDATTPEYDTIVIKNNIKHYICINANNGHILSNQEMTNSNTQNNK